MAENVFLAIYTKGASASFLQMRLNNLYNYKLLATLGCVNPWFIIRQSDVCF